MLTKEELPYCPVAVTVRGNWKQMETSAHTKFAFRAAKIHRT